jgi:hypothetical protein
VAAVQNFIKVFLTEYPILMKAAGTGIQDLKNTVGSLA